MFTILPLATSRLTLFLRESVFLARCVKITSWSWINYIKETQSKDNKFQMVITRKGQGYIINSGAPKKYSEFCEGANEMREISLHGGVMI